MSRGLLRCRITAFESAWNPLPHSDIRNPRAEPRNTRTTRKGILIVDPKSSIFNLQTAIRNLVYRQDPIDGDVAAPLPSKAVTRRANNPDGLIGMASRLGTALQTRLGTALQMERQTVPAGRALLQ